MIQSNLQAANEFYETCSSGIVELTKSQESSRDQPNQETDNLKKETEKLDINIKKVQNGLLDPDEVSSKLLKLKNIIYRKHDFYTKKTFRI